MTGKPDLRPIRQKTLDELEGVTWGPPSYGSHLVQSCHRLRTKPIGEYGTEDLRIMIGQNIGLPYLMPLAIETLEKNPWAAGHMYPGDLPQDDGHRQVPVGDQSGFARPAARRH